MKFNRLILPLILSSSVVLSGCSTVSAVSSVANIALEAAGLKKPDVPELPEAQQPARNIVIRLHASENLNNDPAGRPLALLTKIYKLRQSASFQQMPYDAFLNPQKEKDMLGADVLEVKEVMLVPGQHYEVTEKVSKEAYFVGVVALFRDPAAQRWRVSFPSKEAEQSGITVGLHGCSLTVGIGSAIYDREAPLKPQSPAKCS